MVVDCLYWYSGFTEEFLWAQIPIRRLQFYWSQISRFRADRRLELLESYRVKDAEEYAESLIHAQQRAFGIPDESEVEAVRVQRKRRRRKRATIKSVSGETKVQPGQTFVQPEPMPDQEILAQARFLQMSHRTERFKGAHGVVVIRDKKRKENGR